MKLSILAALPLFACASVDRGVAVEAIESGVWCVHQDRAGVMWFGTWDGGLYRHDGERLTRYTDAHGLPGTDIRGIHEDARGRLLVTTGKGVARFDGQGWSTLEVEPAPPGGGWELDPDDLWLVVDPTVSGPCRYDGERVYRLEFPKSPHEDVHRARSPEVPWALDGVYTTHVDRRGHVWFGTAVVGLCRFDGEEIGWYFEDRLTTTPEGGSFGIRSIHDDADGDVWICNTRQRFEFEDGTVERDGYRRLEARSKPGVPGADSDTAPNFAYYASMVEDEDGALWMACGFDGVWRFDGENVTKFGVGSDVFVSGIYRDREGRYWASAYEHGVFLLTEGRFVPFELSML